MKKLKVYLCLLCFFTPELYSQSPQEYVEPTLQVLREDRYKSLMQNMGWDSWVWPQNRLSLGMKGDKDLQSGFVVDGHVIVETSYLFSTSWKQESKFPDDMEFLSLPMEGYIGEHAYGRFGLNIRKDPFAWKDQMSSQVNVPFSVGEMDFNFPFNSGFSFGGEGWNLQLARGRLSFGPGSEGSLLLSPAVGAQDYILFHGYNDWFGIHLSWVNLDNFDIARDIVTKLPLDPSPDFGYYPASPDEFSGKSKFYGNHGLEFRYDKFFRFGIGETFVFDTGQPDFKYLNPLLLFHNYFLNNSNSDLYMDAEWRPVPGHRLYGQFLMDYLKTWFKNDIYQDTRPGAFGYLAGYETVLLLGTGTVTLGFEGMYSDPFLYNDENQPMVGQRRVNSNYFGRQGETSASRIIDFPLGWEEGPDTLTGKFTAAWRDPLIQFLEFSYKLKGKGERTIRSAYQKGTAANSLVTPSGIAEWSHDSGLKSEVKIFPNLSLEASVHGVYILQKNHLMNNNAWDFYGSIGVKWDVK